jgi:hypothetical protein
VPRRPCVAGVPKVPIEDARHARTRRPRQRPELSGSRCRYVSLTRAHLRPVHATLRDSNPGTTRRTSLTSGYAPIAALPCQWPHHRPHNQAAPTTTPLPEDLRLHTQHMKAHTWAREVSNLRPLPCEPRAASAPAPHGTRRCTTSPQVRAADRHGAVVRSEVLFGAISGNPLARRPPHSSSNVHSIRGRSNRASLQVIRRAGGAVGR